jgi:hypothetical protein
MIQRTPEILENVPSDKPKIDGNEQIIRQPIQRLLCIGVALYNEGVWVRVCEPVKQSLKVSEVALGPP